MIPGPALPKLSECRDCHAPIRFVRMAATGRAMPVNPAPTPGLDTHGTVCAHLTGAALIGYVISKDHPPRDGWHRFRPHYATCQKQRATPPPTQEPDEALF